MITSIYGIPIEVGNETKIVLSKECYWAVQSTSFTFPDSICVVPHDKNTETFRKELAEVLNELRNVFLKRGCEL